MEDDAGNDDAGHEFNAATWAATPAVVKMNEELQMLSLLVRLIIWQRLFRSIRMGWWLTGDMVFLGWCSGAKNAKQCKAHERLLRTAAKWRWDSWCSAIRAAKSSWKVRSQLLHLSFHVISVGGLLDAIFSWTFYCLCDACFKQVLDASSRNPALEVWDSIVFGILSHITEKMQAYGCCTCIIGTSSIALSTSQKCMLPCREDYCVLIHVPGYLGMLWQLIGILHGQTFVTIDLQLFTELLLESLLSLLHHRSQERQSTCQQSMQWLSFFCHLPSWWF